MDNLQRLSTGIVLAITICGVLGGIYNYYMEPNLNNGKYFESAWLDIKDEQLTLYVEFVPDGHGAGVLAIAEAVCRVKEKSWINPAIDGRPIVAIGMIREDTILVPLSAVVIYGDQKVCGKDIDPKKAIRSSVQNMTFLYNGTTIDVVNRSSGEKFAVNLSEFKDSVEHGELLFETASYVPVIYKYPDCLD